MTHQSAHQGHTGSIGDRLSEMVVNEMRNLAGAAAERATAALRNRVSGLTDRLTGYAEHAGSPAVVAAAKGAKEIAGGKSPFKAALSGGLAAGKEGLKRLFGRGKTRKLKLTNIIEWVDVGVPLRVAYNQWTEFEDIPRFTKKVEKVDRESDTKLNWRAQIFLSHRDWESEIVEMIPDERIVWRSKGPKGHVDGGVSFHALTPTLTRVVVVLEYYPKGLFEHTGNIWRAQGRRARLELKHYVRHTMTQTILHPDELEGWRGVIRDGEVEMDHDTAVRQERAEREERGGAPPDEERGSEDQERRAPARDRRDRREYRREDQAATAGRPPSGPGRRRVERPAERQDQGDDRERRAAAEDRERRTSGDDRERRAAGEERPVRRPREG